MAHTMTANLRGRVAMQDPNPFVPEPNPFPPPRAYSVVREYWGDPRTQRTISAAGPIQAAYLRGQEGFRLVAVVVQPAFGLEQDVFLLICDEFLGVPWVESALGLPNVVRFSCRHKKCPVPGWTLWSGGMEAVYGVGNASKSRIHLMK
jgi:hypothetical protein